MSKPKISIILPIYNVGDYIEESLDSILNQSMIDDLEVIMVDDGSTDKSRYIIEKYALDYDNFHAFHKENEGQAIARNYGMSIAQGDFIHFLDPDDFLAHDAYEILYGLALEYDSDIVIGNALRFARYNLWEDILFKNSFKGISEDINSTKLEKLPQLVWDTAVWNKLYKREFLVENEITFPNEKIFFEDLLFSLNTYVLADSITITKDIIYYWRLRGDQSSVTQQDFDIINFKDRLKILRLKHELLTEYNVGQNVVNEECLKWINHDLKFFIKRFNHFPKEYHKELFEDICELVNLIPIELIENLNSYKKVLFKMILNRDFDNFVLFAPLENELFENPEIPSFIDDRYKDYFDFNEAVKDEELISELIDVDVDENNLFLDFKSTINYLTDENKHEISASLVESDNQYPLEVNILENPQIKIPLSFIKDKNHSKIKISFKFSDFEKENFLKNRQRKSLEQDEFYIDLDTGVNSHLYIDIRQKNDNLIEVNDISFDGNEFAVKGVSKNEVSQIYIENVISFERIAYPIKYIDNTQFCFKIPYNDLLKTPIKKWEMNCENSLNSIRVIGSFEFFDIGNKTRFINSRNKILIEHDIFDIVEELNDFNDKNKDLKSQIYSLKNEKSKLIGKNDDLNEKNKLLEDNISEFKSRKVVKIADKLKFN